MKPRFEILKQYGDDNCTLAGEQLIHVAKLESAVSVFAAASAEIRGERPCGRVVLFDHIESVNVVTRKMEWLRTPLLGYEKGKVVDERRR